MLMFGELTFRLGDAEEGPDAHADEDGAEEKVGAVSQVRNHVWSGPRDDEGAEPSVGSGQGHTEHTDVEWEDLGGDRPTDGHISMRCGWQ
jgi:hypothetical protein